MILFQRGILLLLLLYVSSQGVNSAETQGLPSSEDNPQNGEGEGEAGKVKEEDLKSGEEDRQEKEKQSTKEDEKTEKVNSKGDSVPEESPADGSAASSSGGDSAISKDGVNDQEEVSKAQVKTPDQDSAKPSQEGSDTGNSERNPPNANPSLDSDTIVQRGNTPESRNPDPTKESSHKVVQSAEEDSRSSSSSEGASTASVDSDKVSAEVTANTNPTDTTLQREGSSGTVHEESKAKVLSSASGNTPNEVVPKVLGQDTPTGLEGASPAVDGQLGDELERKVPQAPRIEVQRPTSQERLAPHKQQPTQGQSHTAAQGEVEKEQSITKAVIPLAPEEPRKEEKNVPNEQNTERNTKQQTTAESDKAAGGITVPVGDKTVTGGSVPTGATGGNPITTTDVTGGSVPTGATGGTPITTTDDKSAPKTPVTDAEKASKDKAADDKKSVPKEKPKITITDKTGATEEKVADIEKKSVPPKADAPTNKDGKTTSEAKVLPKVSVTVPPIPDVNKTTILSATAISSTIPAVLITSVVFLYLYNW